MDRVHQIICPKCKAVLNSKEGVAVGKELHCPKCKVKFKVAAPDRDDEEEETPRPKISARPPREEDDQETPKAKRRSRDDDDDEDEAPKAKRRSHDDDEDDEEAPKARRRSREEEEEEDRPRRKRTMDEDDEPQSAYAKLKSNIYVRITVLVILLGIAGVLGYLLWEKNKKERENGHLSPPISVMEWIG